MSGSAVLMTLEDRAHQIPTHEPSMSEISHFFAARVTSVVSLRMALERARIQAILGSERDGRGAAPTLLSPLPARRWVGFASPSDNREALCKLAEQLVEIFDSGDEWSVSLCMGQEKLVLRSETLEPARDGSGTSVSQRDWLRRFFGRPPDALLATLSTGSVPLFCKELGIPYLELVDQDVVAWEQLAREFPGRSVLDSESLG